MWLVLLQCLRRHVDRKEESAEILQSTAVEMFRGEGYIIVHSLDLILVCQKSLIYSSVRQFHTDREGVKMCSDLDSTSI